MAARYKVLVEHYERCFMEHGATHKGVDWPRAEDVATRHRVMLGVMRESTDATLLDLGCGYGALKETLDRLELPVQYQGLDLSLPMIEAARHLHPGTSFECRDILLDPLPPESVDYVVMNGVLTEKQELSFDQMEQFAQAMLVEAFRICRRGIAFNVMSAHVDWQREDLFHLPFDRLAKFLKAAISRHFMFRADYGLYEYTTYVYRAP